MEKSKWDELYKSMSEKYENYYEIYIQYRKRARKDKKKARRELMDIISWTSQNVKEHYELGELLLDVCLKEGVNPKVITKPEYYLEIVQQVLRAMSGKTLPVK